MKPAPTSSELCRATAAPPNSGDNISAVEKSALVDGLLSIIIRFHAGGSLKLLDEALFSLAIQQWNNVELVIAVQNPTSELSRAINDLVAVQPWRMLPAVQTVSLVVPAGVDGRTQLLNRGLHASRGRYLAFLDYDDIVYPHGYASLIGRLQSHGHALAVGGCMQAKVVARDGSWHVEERTRMSAERSIAQLCWGNFVPIHSYVIDRSRLNGFELGFDEQLTRLEDYEFLLRLTAQHEPDFGLIDTMVCEYRVRLDGSNTTLQFQAAPSVDNQRSWQQCTEIVNERKRALRYTVTADQLAQLVQARMEKERLAAEIRSHYMHQATVIEEQQQRLITQMERVGHQDEVVAHQREQIEYLGSIIAAYRRAFPEPVIQFALRARDRLSRLVAAWRSKARRHPSSIPPSADSAALGACRAPESRS